MNIEIKTLSEDLDNTYTPDILSWLDPSVKYNPYYTWAISNQSEEVPSATIENKTNIDDVSRQDNIILLYGEYGSNDYLESTDDISLVVAAPQMKFSTDDNITVKGGGLDSLHIPDIMIIDDVIRKYYYYDNKQDPTVESLISEVKEKINIEADLFSKSAKIKLEKIGGTFQLSRSNFPIIKK